MVSNVERLAYIRKEKQKFEVPEFLKSARKSTGFEKVLNEEMEKLNNGRNKG